MKNKIIKKLKQNLTLSKIYILIIFIKEKNNKDELLIKELLENKGKNNDNFGNQNNIRLYMKIVLILDL